MKVQGVAYLNAGEHEVFDIDLPYKLVGQEFDFGKVLAAIWMDEKTIRLEIEFEVEPSELFKTQ